MHTSIVRNTTVQILFAISFVLLSNFTLGQAEKEASADGAKKNQIEIKDFHFNPAAHRSQFPDRAAQHGRQLRPGRVESAGVRRRPQGNHRHSHQNLGRTPHLSASEPFPYRRKRAS